MYKFIIDTDSYAGNFERDMCAFLTGHVGECEVGREFAERFISEVGPEFHNVEDKADEHGVFRPCEMETTPGWFGVPWVNGGFRETPGFDLGTLRKERDRNVDNYYRRIIQRAQDIKTRILAGEVVRGWTTEECEIEIKRTRRTMQQEKQRPMTITHVYQSVAILFGGPPTAEQIEIMKSRAPLFRDARREIHGNQKFDLTVEGFRLHAISETITPIPVP